MKVSSVAEMRALDGAAVERYGIAEELLMENAGLAAQQVLAQEIGVTGKRFVVFCGGGNNGGDGLVVARKILSNGGTAKVFVLGDAGKYRGAAKTNWDIISRLPIDVRPVESTDSIRPEVFHCDAVIDAIFGTGLTREVGGLYRDVIALINESGKPVLAVDIPSGIHGDTGAVMGIAVKADYTVTFGLPKLGMMRYPGYELCGQLFVSHISFPPELYESDSLRVALNRPLSLPPRPRDAHKGTMGQALFVAGAAGYFGAPYFAAMSYLKAGGGYSRLASPRSITPFLANKGSEIVFLPQDETEAGSIARANKDALLEWAGRMDMVVLGPGLSLQEETQQLARELAAQIERPLLIDGDGITALCRALEVVRARSAQTVLTPHLGEMARLTDSSVAEVKEREIDLLQRTTADLGAMIVLKGAHSLIGYPDGRVFVNLSGNPGMASAGSGDVLTGTIAAMLGLGLPLEDAVREGVFVHGLAGDLAADEHGEDGITAQDILDHLPLAVSLAREGLPDFLRDRYAGAQVI